MNLLQYVQSNPNLGVILSDDLTFDKHIAKITKKASSMLGFIRHNLRHCPEDLKSVAYFSLVRSGLEYASSIWDAYLQKDIDALEKIQCQAARFVENEYRS